MTAVAAARAARGGLGGGLAIGAVLLGIVALLWLAGGARDLHRSAAGFAGLVAWLEGNEVDARTFHGQGYLVQGEVGLRVLPLFDTDLARPHVPPETPEDFVAQTSEVDLDGYVVATKIELLPTLVVLPKWRTGMRALGAAHPELLIPEAELSRLVGQIRGLRGQLRRQASGYVELAMPSRERPAGLYHLQTLDGSGCEPLIGTERDMLLGRCTVAAGKAGGAEGSARFWLLADPDLMNTHGLTRAGNAAVALALVREMAAGQPVVLDLSTEVLTVERSLPEESDDWEQAARLFAWPFSMVWLGFAAVSALVLWRALTRYGPVTHLYDDDAPRASKEVSIDAKARLLRLARHDRALLTAYIRQRLAALAAELTGPHLPRGVDPGADPGADPLAVLTRLVGRRAPALAEELAESARLPEYRRDWPDVLLRRLQRFEASLAKVRNEFGRAPGARG